MKALSVRQPWAWAILNGKPVENRDWYSGYRGPLLIHAAKTFDDEGWQWIAANENRLVVQLPAKHSFQLGAIIGRVDMTDCVKFHTSRWFFGPQGFVLANPQAFAIPVPYRGMPGLFDVPDDILRKAGIPV